MTRGINDEGSKKTPQSVSPVDPTSLPSVQIFRKMKRRDMHNAISHLEELRNTLEKERDIKYCHIEHIKSQAKEMDSILLEELQRQEHVGHHYAEKWDKKLIFAQSNIEKQKTERNDLINAALRVQNAVEQMKLQVKILAEEIQSHRRQRMEEEKQRDHGKKKYKNSLYGRLCTISEDLFEETKNPKILKSCKGRPGSPHPKKCKMSDSDFNKLMMKYQEKAKALDEMRKRKEKDVPLWMKEMQELLRARVLARQNPPKTYLGRHQQQKMEVLPNLKLPRIYHPSTLVQNDHIAPPTCFDGGVGSGQIGFNDLWPKAEYDAMPHKFQSCVQNEIYVSSNIKSKSAHAAYPVPENELIKDLSEYRSDGELIRKNLLNNQTEANMPARRKEKDGKPRMKMSSSVSEKKGKGRNNKNHERQKQLNGAGESSRHKGKLKKQVPSKLQPRQKLMAKAYK